MNTTNTNTNEQEAVMYQTGKDLARSVFIVSVLLNLTFFITWLVVTTSAHYSFLLVNQ
jgi:hypothetical protein